MINKLIYLTFVLLCLFCIVKAEENNENLTISKIQKKNIKCKYNDSAVIHVVITEEVELLREIKSGKKNISIDTNQSGWNKLVMFYEKHYKNKHILNKIDSAVVRHRYKIVKLENHKNNRLVLGGSKWFFVDIDSCKLITTWEEK